MKYDFRTRLLLLGLGFLLSLFCLSIFISPVSAAVVVGNTSTSPTGGPVTSKTWSHTVSGTNRLLVVGIGTRDYATVSSVTYGGVALTRSTTVSAGSGNYPHSEIWYLLAPAVGTANIVVTLSISDWPTCGAITFTNVNQSTPIRGSSNDTSSSTSTAATSLTVNPTVSGDLVLDSLSYWNSGTYATAGAGQTIYNAAKIDNAWSNSMSVKTATTTTTTTTWNIITNTVGWAQSGISIVPIAGTPPVISATAPTSNSTISTQVVSYTLSEAVVAGSIQFARTGGTADGTVHTCTLQGTALSSGAHTNLTLATGANACAAWTNLVNGSIYTVTYNATDSDGMSATTVTNTNVTYGYFSGSGSGTSGSPYLITNCTQLQEMKYNLSAYYNLSNNIDCSGVPNLTPIGIYTGVFNGNNYTISNITMTPAGGGDNIGLFTKISACTIQNLNLTNISISTTSHSSVGALAGAMDPIACSITNVNVSGSISGSNYVGGLIGWQNTTAGTITNCSSSATMTANANGLGGLVGNNYGSIVNSYATGSVTSNTMYLGGLVGLNYGSISKSYATGNVNGNAYYAGGLVGFEAGSIINSYAMGNVSGVDWVGGCIGRMTTLSTSITNSYSKGLVTSSGTYVGGFMGIKEGTGTINSCYYDTITSGRSDTGKGTPKTTTEMKLRYTFSGWDFSTIWGISPSLNSGYPQFSTTGGGGSAPTISNVVVNSGSDITLTGGTTKSVTVTGQVTDLDGYANIGTVNTKLYYSAVANAENCTLNPANCYTATCSKSNCSGNSCDVSCSFNVQYYATPSDASSSIPSAYWSAYMSVTDIESLSGSGFSSSGSPDILTLRSLTLDKASIDFGTIYPGSNTGSTNQTVLITNQGNVTFDAELYGTKFCNDYPTCSTSYVSIASTQCKFNTSAFTYSSGGTALPSTATSYQLNNTIYPSNTKTLYLGIAVPYFSSAGLHTGEIFINAITDF